MVALPSGDGARRSELLHPLGRASFLSTAERKAVVAEKSQAELLQGTLDLLVLKALQVGSMHGWGITDLLRQESGDVLQVGQGSLYPALYRLERQGLVSSSWATTENNRRARYYALTAAGRKHLQEERQSWRRISRAVDLILDLPAGRA